MSLNNSLIRKFHDALLRLQRKRRFVAISHGVRPDQAAENIGYTEEAVLLILDYGTKKNVRDLSELIGIERSWMSRITTMLEEQKLISSEVDPNDRRSKVLEITRRGKLLLEDLDRVVTLIMKETLKALNESEQAKLAQFFSRVADGMNADPQNHRNSRHAVDTELGRISRACGVLGESVLGSGLSITKLQTLKILLHQAEPIQIADLDQLLPFDLSTISRTIADFEKKGWINKQPSSFDKRGFFLLVTSLGSSKLEAYYQKAMPQFEKALKGFSSSDLSKMLELLSLATQDLALVPHKGRNNIELKSLRSDDNLDKESKALYKRIKIDTSLIKDQHSTRSLGLFEDGKLKACSYIVNDSKTGALVDFIITGKELDNKQCLALARACFENKR